MNNYKRFIREVNEGISRPIKSRKHKFNVTPQHFYIISSTYFRKISVDHNFKFIFKNSDKQILLIILRYYYNLWVEIFDLTMIIYKEFPNKFLLLHEVNKYNHPHTPKVFLKGTEMNFIDSNTSMCNWLKGIPLWINEEKTIDGLTPYVQINYEYIHVIK